MSSLSMVTKNEAPEESAQLYMQIEKSVGFIPNIYKVYGHSPSVLKANLQLDSILDSGNLTKQEIEIIALVTSEYNQCEYCQAAHSAIGKMVGMDDEEILSIRKRVHSRQQYQALIDFTQLMLEKKGNLNEEDIAQFLHAGYSEASVVEVIAQVAKNFFNNYTNHIAKIPVDFPAVFKV